MAASTPWWNTGLNLTVISPTQPMHALSVMFDQTLGDGVGVNIGFINAVPEPGQWALLLLWLFLWLRLSVPFPQHRPLPFGSSGEQLPHLHSDLPGEGV